MVHTQRIRLTLFLTAGEIVVILHRHEFMPAVLFSRIERLGEPPRGDAAGTEIAYFS